MAPIDPINLLKALDPLLFDDGGIKEASAVQFSSLMKKFSKKLVSRCVYVNVLTVTKPDVLEKLLDQGSWGTINGWLADAKDTNNMSLLIRLLNLCKLLPMTVERLKENNTPKIVKSLSKFEGDDIQAISHELVTKWMTIIKGDGNTTENNKKKKKVKASKENKEQKDPKKHGKRDSPTKERKESISSENVDELEELSKPAAKVRGIKRTSSDKAISPENFYGDTKPDSKEEPALKKVKVERTRKSSNDKSPEEVGEVVKSEPKSELLLKKSRIEKRKGLCNNKPISPELYEDVKIEIKPEPLLKKPRTDRPKTVKSFGAKFRATGLEQAAPLPKKISKKTPIVVDKSVVAAVAKSAVTKRLNSTLPERITEKKIKPETLLNITEMQTPSGGIKLIPAKPKPTHILTESASFMDALVAQPVTPLIKRKKKLPVKPVTPPPASPPVKPPKLQFYKDTLETEEPSNNEEEKTKKEDGDNDDASATSNKEEEDAETEKPTTPNDSEPASADASVEDSIDKDIKKDLEEEMEVQSGELKEDEIPVPGRLKSILSHHRNRKTKKSVQWVTDESLREVFYFELDETERVNVSRHQDFGDMKSMEARQEKEAIKAARRRVGDKMEEKIPWWTVPILIEIPPPLVEPGYLSQERETQRIRHQSVLQAIYFSKESTPDSPQEPDPEIVIPQEPKIIPLDEENMVGSVVDHSAQKLPTPKLPEVLSSLINIPLTRSIPTLPNHMEQDSINMSNPMMQQPTPASPTSPYDPGEPMSPHILPNMGPLIQPQQQQAPLPMPQQPMFNAPPRLMVEPDVQMPPPPQNNWGGMDAGLMGPPPDRFFTPNVFPMNPYPMMEPGMPPPGIPHMGGGGMQRMGGGRMMRPMGKIPPYHPRPGGPRRGVPHVPCRHFIAGGCRFGANCNFLHPGVNGPAL